MHRKSLLFLSALVLFVLVSAFVSATPAAAQSATTGAITGTVFDQHGAIIAGATVTATNTETGASRAALSNGAGVYRISEVTPGSYTVAVTSKGFEGYRQLEVLVTVGALVEISPKLVVGNVNETVQVSGENSLMHTQSSEISTTIDQNAIDNLPINGRRWSSFALLTPGVVSDSNGFGLLSFRGISTLLNNSTVDGADNNQAFFSEERGRTRSSYTISQAAVQEFQVNASNYSAEYGRAAGGVINTVTKSGGNQLHGELFFYDRDNEWGATNPYTLQTTQVPNSNQFQTYVYKPKDWRKQFGFGVGGPLIHDKLFWFYSYDQEIRNFPGTARSSDPTLTFAPADATLPAGTTCSGGTFNAGTVTSYGTGDPYACAEANALSSGGSLFNYQQGAAYYGQGLGIISSFLGTVPRTSNQALNFPKLDWQINDKNHLSLQYNRFRRSSPAGYQTQASNFYGRASFGNDFVKEDFGIARLTTVLSPNMVNQLLFQYGRDFEYSTSQTPLPNELPLSNNQYNRPPDTQIGYEFDTRGFDIGKPVFFDIGALPEERRMQGIESITWSHGRHTFKGGVEINRVFDYINDLYGGNGSYSYDYNWDFIADYLHQTTGIGGTKYLPQYYSFSQTFGNPAGEVATTDYAGFLTDDWRVSPRLTLTLGVRYEYEYVPENPFINTNGNVATGLCATCGIPQTANRPDDRNNVGPRLGFAWDIYGTGNTILRGGYGMYYGRIINSNIIQTYLNSGGANSQLQYSASGQCTGLDYPAIYTTATQYATQCPGANTVAAYLDNHLQNPQVHEMDLALEQNLGWNTVLSITYMGSLGRELPIALDQNLGPASSTRNFVVANNPTPSPVGYVTYPNGGKKAPLLNGSIHNYLYFGNKATVPGTSTPLFSPGYYQVLEFKSAANSNYNALAIQLNRRFSQGFSMLSNYTWAHALDFNPYLSTVDGSTSEVLNPLDLQSEYGNSSLNVQQRFVLALTYRPTFQVTGWKDQLANGWQAAPIVQAQTGLPYSAGLSNAGLPGGAFSGILGAGGTNRVPDLQRNAFTMPKTSTLNMRVGKNLFYNHGDQHYRLELFAEAFNLLNHQNITSVNTVAYYNCKNVSASGCITADGSTPVGAPNYLIANPLFGTYLNSNSNTVYSQRQIQLSARLHF
jgi:hypothetical protein